MLQPRSRISIIDVGVASRIGFCIIENKFFPTETNKNKPRSDLRDAKQWAREIRFTYPCRSHSGNVQMNMIGVVVLASPPRDLIQSKCHNGRLARWMVEFYMISTCVFVGPCAREGKARHRSTQVQPSEEIGSHWKHWITFVFVHILKEKKIKFYNSIEGVLPVK
jgi:hypothetical protein